jgi:hypothetical protein
MYFMNADGTINEEKYVSGHTEISPEPDPKIVKEDYRRKKHSFNLLKRYPKCDCTNCWKQFMLSLIFYTIVIYLLYLIVNFIFSLIDEKKLITPELPKPIVN